ncbi:MAG: DUF1772 domain-containing protein [Saprospiraceae bacterium]|nr:DUF1772 domain-containing protein [Lewinellaceae bacterium]
MNKQLVRLLNLIMAGLIAGTLFGIWIGYNPQNLSPQAYVEQQQNAINALNTLMPILGLITIILTLTSATLHKSNATIFGAFLGAAGLFIVSGLVTRFGNQPINSIVMTWNKAEVPTTWVELRDKWWFFHTIRTATALGAFCLICWVNIFKLTAFQN